VRNFQPPITERKLWLYNPKPCREIGVLKEAIKEAILEGEIQMNIRTFDFMVIRANKLGLKKV
jgi:tRNA nucleotidyltransferase (CCA-adding enzyme)